MKTDEFHGYVKAKLESVDQRVGKLDGSFEKHLIEEMDVIKAIEKRLAKHDKLIYILLISTWAAGLYGPEVLQIARAFLQM